MLTWRSGLPSSKSAILIFAPLTSLKLFLNINIFIIVVDHLLMCIKNKLPYLISLIFCPPRPIMHPIKSFGIVISCVCTLCMFLGGPPTFAAAAAAATAAAVAAGFIGCCCYWGGGCNCGGGGGGVWFVIIDAIH